MIPPLHVVVPDRVARRNGFLPAAFGMLEDADGELALHLRLKETPGRRVHELAVELAAAARRHGGWCVVNERVDVALTADAQAVQLGGGALPLDAVRRVAGPELPVGVSVHGPDEARRATEEGANHLVLGTIFGTPSHPGRPGAGPELVEACRRRVDVPLVAIGGVDPGRVPEVVEAGADGVAAVRAVWDADRPRRAARAFLEALASARAG